MLVQIECTSLVGAKLVTVNLDSLNMSGVRLLDATNATQVIDTIRPGETGTATFHLEALRTGRVTASTLELVGAGGIVSGRQLLLKAGISEQGVPLSPDTLI